MSTGDENAGAAGLAPHSLVARASLCPVVVSGVEFPVVDPQLAVEEMQLFDTGMRMRWVTRAGREAHQHADPVPFRVGRERIVGLALLQAGILTYLVSAWRVG